MASAPGKSDRRPVATKPAIRPGVMRLPRPGIVYGEDPAAFCALRSDPKRHHNGDRVTAGLFEYSMKAGAETANAPN